MLARAIKIVLICVCLENSLTYHCAWGATFEMMFKPRGCAVAVTAL